MRTKLHLYTLLLVLSLSLVLGSSRAFSEEYAWSAWSALDDDGSSTGIEWRAKYSHENKFKKDKPHSWTVEMRNVGHQSLRFGFKLTAVDIPQAEIGKFAKAKTVKPGETEPASQYTTAGADGQVKLWYQFRLPSKIRLARDQAAEPCGRRYSMTLYAGHILSMSFAGKKHTVKFSKISKDDRKALVQSKDFLSFWKEKAEKHICSYKPSNHSIDWSKLLRAAVIHQLNAVLERSHQERCKKDLNRPECQTKRKGIPTGIRL